MLKKQLTWISFLLATSIAALISISSIANEGQLIVRSGKHCPSGYQVSGEYCKPKAGPSAAAAIEKKGSCPAGYRTDGAYCASTTGRGEAPHAVDKKGPCPPGYKTSGKYCVEKL